MYISNHFSVKKHTKRYVRTEAREIERMLAINYSDTFNGPMLQLDLTESDDDKNPRRLHINLGAADVLKIVAALEQEVPDHPHWKEKGIKTRLDHYRHQARLDRAEELDRFIEDTSKSEFPDKWNRDRARIERAILDFPEQFGLRANPGEVFVIDKVDSFIGDNDETWLYTHIVRKDGSTGAFARCLPEELKQQIVKL